MSDYRLVETFEYRGLRVEIKQFKDYQLFYASAIDESSGRGVLRLNQDQNLIDLKANMQKGIDTYLDLVLISWEDLTNSIISYAANDDIYLDTDEVAALVKRLYKTSPQLFT